LWRGQSRNIVTAQVRGTAIFTAQVRGIAVFTAQVRGTAVFTAQVRGIAVFTAQVRGTAVFTAQVRGTAVFIDPSLQTNKSRLSILIHRKLVKGEWHLPVYQESTALIALHLMKFHGHNLNAAISLSIHCVSEKI